MQRHPRESPFPITNRCLRPSFPPPAGTSGDTPSNSRWRCPGVRIENYFDRQIVSFPLLSKSPNLAADKGVGESMRKQGSLLIVLFAACVALFAACVPAPVPPTPTTSSTSTIAPPGKCDVRGPGVDLSDCDLSFANLASANLSGAFLTGADLTNANLSEANLSYAVLNDANLTGVIWSNTTCPNAVVQSTECPRTSAG